MKRLILWIGSKKLNITNIQFFYFKNNNPSISIRIEGHTDNMGNRNLNIQLSLERANAVREHLISKGISKKRLSIIGYGPDKPITKSTSPEERKRNRRVEFRIL